MEKKFPELIARIDREWPGEGPIRVMFQDEARFGRISDTRHCWCPKPVRPLCYAMVTQEYTYAYAAVSVDGELDTLILPHTNSDCMQVFIDEVASHHPEDRIIMILDGAGWHTSRLLTVPDNMSSSRCRPTHRNSTRPNTSGTNSGRNHSITAYLIVLILSKFTWKYHCGTWKLTRCGCVRLWHGRG